MAKKGNKNSLKHGLFAKEILLPNESPEEFKKLHQAFRLQYNPIGEAEEAMVRELAAIQWQIGRLDVWLRRAFELDDRVASEIGQLPFNIIVELAKTTNEKANILLIEQRAKALNLDHQLAEINPALDNVARILKIREQLERSFDKGVSRIANAKEFKKLYGAKLIELLPQVERTSISLDEIDNDRAKESENVPKLNGGETA